MTNKKKYICIGKIHSAQGLKGDLFILLFSGEAGWVSQWKTLDIGLADSEGPDEHLSIQNKKTHNKQGKKGYVLRIGGVTDRNRADELIGRRVYVPEDYLVSKKGETIYLREILTFEVIDKSRGTVGVVSGFSDNGAQDLISITHTSGDVFEVPFVEPLLVSINFNEKKIHMDIPSGLVAGEEL